MATPLPTITPTPVPLNTPSPDAIHTAATNLITYLQPHYFELAQIVLFLGTGAALSILHSIFFSKRLPKWANVALPLGYAGLFSVAGLYIKGDLDWNNWYMVFTQVLTGAVAWYATLTLVNRATPDKTNLPTVTEP